MKKLETIFVGRGEVSGVLFTQLFRFNDLCLYKRTGGTFEVIRVRYQKAGIRKFGDKEIFYEEKEYYPKGDDWGTHEWHCDTIDRAIKRFNEEIDLLGYKMDKPLSKINLTEI